MESYETALKAHDDFQAVRQAALDALLSKRSELDAKIRELQGLGKPGTNGEKKRGRPPKEKS